MTVIKKSILQSESHFEAQVDTFTGSQQVGKEPELTAMPSTIDQNQEQVHQIISYDCQQEEEYSPHSIVVEAEIH